jgi:hypothetical protein
VAGVPQADGMIAIGTQYPLRGAQGKDACTVATLEEPCSTQCRLRPDVARPDVLPTCGEYGPIRQRVPPSEQIETEHR